MQKELRVAVMDIEITIIYDNNPYKSGLETGWGFACLVRGSGKTILFDTGGDGRLLLKNMEKRSIHPKEIDIIFLSHIHNDHVGGLQHILPEHPGIEVYLLESFPEHFKVQVKNLGATVLEVREFMRVCKHAFSTGELGLSIKEQSLVVWSEKGFILITGCAHPGILHIVDKVRELMMDSIFMVIGGYHLGTTGGEETENIVSHLKKVGIQYIVPCHCTGDEARQVFQKSFGERCLDAGVGRVIETGRLR
jgi:7,8-dihydropterin-6-yl-methyl-4-(beta-D-ribofuranosyl)aminobenzene 5'-phosphate synthase